MSLNKVLGVRHSRSCGLVPLAVLVAAAAAGACSDSTGSSGVPATVQVVSGDSQSAVVATQLAQPLVIVVHDSNDKPVTGVSVKFLTSDSGSFSAATATTDTLGQATTLFTPGKKAGSVVVSASVAGITSATFQVNATPAAPSDLSKASGDAQTGADGTALAAPLVVQITDEFGNPVAGVAITWTVTGGTLSSADAVTDANGEAHAVLTLGASSGSETVTAHIAGATDVTFTETAQ